LTLTAESLEQAEAELVPKLADEITAIGGLCGNILGVGPEHRPQRLVPGDHVPERGGQRGRFQPRVDRELHDDVVHRPLSIAASRCCT